MRTGWPRPGEIELVARRERAAVLAVLARETRDLARAEDAVQDALLAALEAWPRRGMPARPGAWLTVVARRFAWAQNRSFELPWPRRSSTRSDVRTPRPRGAGRAHAAHRRRLTTPEIARAFLLPESTLAQRLARAQRTLQRPNVKLREAAPADTQPAGRPFREQATTRSRGSIPVQPSR